MKGRGPEGIPAQRIGNGIQIVNVQQETLFFQVFFFAALEGRGLAVIVVVVVVVVVVVAVAVLGRPFGGTQVRGRGRCSDHDTGMEPTS